MMKSFMMILAFCLYTATLFAQQKVNTLATQSVFKSQVNGYNYNGKADDPGRKNARELMDSIRNSPKWKAESEAIGAEFYNSAAWKKSKEESAKSLPLWDEHSTTGNKAWQDAVGKSHAELESSEAYKIYEAERKDFNKRLDIELIKQLHKNDPRYKTAFQSH